MMPSSSFVNSTPLAHADTPRDIIPSRGRQPMARVPHVARGTILSGTLHYSKNLSVFEEMVVDKFVLDLT
ncbi:hypothetical protein TNCV_3835761 [Trichonephila clavipes]|nr:hypothetical protein TNCV_3835761 [Trichonephila clavipes]